MSPERGYKEKPFTYDVFPVPPSAVKRAEESIREPMDHLREGGIISKKFPVLQQILLNQIGAYESDTPMASFAFAMGANMANKMLRESASQKGGQLPDVTWEALNLQRRDIALAPDTRDFGQVVTDFIENLYGNFTEGQIIVAEDEKNMRLKIFNFIETLSDGQKNELKSFFNIIKQTEEKEDGRILESEPTLSAHIADSADVSLLNKDVYKKGFMVVVKLYKKEQELHKLRSL